ncbi:MAG: imidazole glycerol phosphate synthase subunit HisF [Desulfobacteraceae bacterium]|nr:imidazole glycerol phosphate synthase subunit HisF [Desulfobacteraceae bacterium]
MVTLLDYGAGNVRSVINALEGQGASVKIVEKNEDILSAERLVFPGVGAFGHMMQVLHQRGYIEPLKAYLASGRPYLGICLGMHALFDASDEALETRGLGILNGRVKQFDIDLAVPHIGWNGVHIKQPSRLFSGFSGGEKFYFVHSYYVEPLDEDVVLTVTDYGQCFVSAVQKGSIVGTQFHPEKSGNAGLRLLKNFMDETTLPAQPAQAFDNTQLAKRIIACLDVRANDQGDLVVTKGDQYDVRKDGNVRNLGKPVELAKRYYDEGADEITFLNITGFRDFPLEDMPMIDVLKQTSRNVFVPLTIGGGIRDYTDKDGKTYSALDVAEAYFRSGADKVSIGSDAVLVAEQYLATGEKTGKSAIEEISRVYGSQAVVISIDPRRVYVASPDDVKHVVIKTGIPGPDNEHYCWYQCTIKGGREGRELDAITFAVACEHLGAGEILLNCIDRDGTTQGFDTELINAVKKMVSIPVIASSGAGSAAHFHEVFSTTGAESALAAGIFHRRDVPIGEVKSYLMDKVPIRE